MRIYGRPALRARMALRSIDAFIRRTHFVFGARRPRITAAVMTRNSAKRLPRLLSQLSQFSDEIIVGVDASSTDNTLKVARRWADRVYQFDITGHTAPARQLVFQYATGDWILSIDDDELVEENFGEVVHDLAGNPGITHALFKRKWIVSLEPCAFVYSPLWYPDWQLRLFRNDVTLAYKPSSVHTGYRVSGPGTYDARSSILHLEPIVIDRASRRKKLQRYGKLGSNKVQDSYFSIPQDIATRPAILPEIEVRRPWGRGKVECDIHQLPPASPFGWKSEVISIDTASEASPGELISATIRVRNTGSLVWMPQSFRPPFLKLANHLKDSQGNLLQQDKDRFGIMQPVLPHGEVAFIVAFRAPERPGTYTIEWDMISERECWFERLGAKTASHTLIVREVSPQTPLLGQVGQR